MANKQYILVTVSGPDHPGITANLMKILVKKNYRLADMGQSVTHGLLSLSFLLDDASNAGEAILKDLLFEAKKMGLTLDFEIIENGSDNTSNLDEKFILSCVSTDWITPQFVGDIASMLADNNINIIRIDNISKMGFRSVEITTNAPASVDWVQLKHNLLSVSDCHQVDMAFLRDNVYRRNKRLIVFDMDSTLIQSEVIDEMAKAMGVGAQISKITEDAMNGKIDFNEWMTNTIGPRWCYIHNPSYPDGTYPIKNRPSTNNNPDKWGACMPKMTHLYTQATYAGSSY